MLLRLTALLIVVGFHLTGCSLGSGVAPQAPRPKLFDNEILTEPTKGRVLSRIDETLNILSQKEEAGVRIHSLKRFREILLAAVDSKMLHGLIAADFEVHTNSGVLFTGYYKPILRGSLTRSERFFAPLYAKPKQHPIPHPTRAELTEGALLVGHELAYIDNPLDAFLAQVQGSTDVQFEDGTIRSYRFDGATDHPYTSIGAELIREGKLKPREASIPQIRAFFETNPQEVREYLNRNNRFVFFKQGSPKTVGSLGAELLDLRSLAVDPDFYPLGSLVSYEAKIPHRTPTGWGEQRVLRFALCQDTGSAIKTPNRVDIFIGSGHSAGEVAGRLRAEGELKVLRAR